MRRLGFAVALVGLAYALAMAADGSSAAEPTGEVCERVARGEAAPAVVVTICERRRLLATY
jgi:hypothetical protein